MSFLLILLVTAHLIQAYFWLWIYNLLPPVEENDVTLHSMPGVSVIIAVKNEASNLKDHLPRILSQTYDNFEVIIVDDHSEDDSASFVRTLVSEHPNLVLLSANDNNGKKNALSLGIKHAKYPWILCTDADCRPNSNQWIKTIIAQHDNADLILGFGPYESKSTMLNAFINYETWYIAVQYMSAALHKRAYMGVGRNLCFRKTLWEEIGGYASHEHLQSGDDDLFVSAAAYKRIVVETDPRSWTISKAPDTFAKLWDQKRRHLSTASSYSWLNQILLSLSFLSSLLIYSLTIILCLLGYYYALLPLLFRFIYLYLVSRRWMKKLDVMRLWFASPFWDLVLVLYYSAQGAMMWRKKKDW